MELIGYVKTEILPKEVWHNLSQTERTLFNQEITCWNIYKTEHVEYLISNKMTMNYIV